MTNEITVSTSNNGKFERRGFKMKFNRKKIPLLLILLIILTSVFAGCMGIPPTPYSGTFTITHIEQNDETYWLWPTVYINTLKVSMDNGQQSTIYASQHFVNRHPINTPFTDTTKVIEDYNSHKILIFTSDTTDQFLAEHPETQSPDGCPVGYGGNVIRVAYVTNYHDIPDTGAHYWAYYDPDGSSKSYLTLKQLMDHINQSGDKYRTDCIYPSVQTHDYWENDGGPMGGYDGEKLTTAFPRMVSLQVNFADNSSAQSIDNIKPVTAITPSESTMGGYGCPGCPQNFMGFAEDMCTRFGSSYTVSDGTNTLKCSELIDETGEMSK